MIPALLDLFDEYLKSVQLPASTRYNNSEPYLIHYGGTTYIVVVNDNQFVVAVVVDDVARKFGEGMIVRGLNSFTPFEHYSIITQYDMADPAFDFSKITDTIINHAQSARHNQS